MGREQPSSYVFDTVQSKPGDVATRKRQYFTPPSGFRSADLDGIGAPEIILTSGHSGSATSGTFILFDR